jgi:hypothetical protein
MNRFMIVSVSFLFTVFAFGCGDDGTPADGSTDTSTPIDSTTTDTGTPTDTGITDTGTPTDTGITDTGTPTDGGADTGASDAGTPCGADVCNPATEICFECACGGPTSFECMPVPSDCTSDRTCECIGPELCTSGLAVCTDRGDNHVYCDTGLD